MSTTTRNELQPDQPLVDTTPYGYGPDDSISDVTENAAITHHTLKINEKSISYAARAGHLVTTDTYSARPAAKLFYVAFTVDGSTPSTRPVTFFYNGGPGSSSVFLLLGSFGPRRIKTSMPSFTPPAPYVLEDNQDSLLDQSDLVFIDPVGTGYSTAIEPATNKDFWGVDQDASCIKQFIKRYLTVFNRWNSPKYLFGESYGTPRTSVLSWMLHEDGVDLNGIVLQSSILDYSQAGNPVGILPTFAADAWFHKKVSVSPVPSDLAGFMEKVEEFAGGPYADALSAFPNVDPNVLQYLSDMLGIPPVVLQYWRLDPSTGNGSVFLTSLLLDAGLAVGAYDGRVTGEDTGIAEYVAPNSGGNDPTMAAVGGVYTAMWNVYLNEELQYTSISPFMDLNDQAFANWDFGHIDPTGAQRGGIGSLYTAGDLAAAIAVNPYLRVFSANGYYDAVTPFFQTILNFQNMPLGSAQIQSNLTVRNYPSGHMIYLDNASRTAMKADLSSFYGEAETHVAAIKAAVLPEQTTLAGAARYRRRSSRTPY
ncbi:S10 family peptidase [Paraburkholderia elongata]|uniref:Peptidase S1 n=1 Tax=Paraburkholderia elongata TaxID=2675747 RepID=A0A972NSI3_9BURK|nr:peptidase S1 [Paraburkholderia elongata]NPT58177.1 peptidase S1 [Paraburkholderia elongata]NPT62134.1 peptidase S1 [Paraburkholderia elongata]